MSAHEDNLHDEELPDLEEDETNYLNMNANPTVTTSAMQSATPIYNVEAYLDNSVVENSEDEEYRVNPANPDNNNSSIAAVNRHNIAYSNRVGVEPAQLSVNNNSPAPTLTAADYRQYFGSTLSSLAAHLHISNYAELFRRTTQALSLLDDQLRNNPQINQLYQDLHHTLNQSSNTASSNITPPINNPTMPQPGTPAVAIRQQPTVPIPAMPLSRPQNQSAQAISEVAKAPVKFSTSAANPLWQSKSAERSDVPRLVRPSAEPARHNAIRTVAARDDSSSSQPSVPRRRIPRVGEISSTAVKRIEANNQSSAVLAREQNNMQKLINEVVNNAANTKEPSIFLGTNFIQAGTAKFLQLGKAWLAANKVDLMLDWMLRDASNSRLIISCLRVLFKLSTFLPNETHQAFCAVPDLMGRIVLLRRNQNKEIREWAVKLHTRIASFIKEEANRNTNNKLSAQEVSSNVNAMANPGQGNPAAASPVTVASASSSNNNNNSVVSKANVTPIELTVSPATVIKPATTAAVQTAACQPAAATQALHLEPRSQQRIPKKRPAEDVQQSYRHHNQSHRPNNPDSSRRDGGQQGGGHTDKEKGK
jgi:hypothetical protein